MPLGRTPLASPGPSANTGPGLPRVPSRPIGYLQPSNIIGGGTVSPTTPGYEYLARERRFTAVPTITVTPQAPPASGTGGTAQPPPGAPTQIAATLVPIPRVSETYPAPTVVGGIPYADSARNPWLPSVARSVWAKQLQLVIAGNDVTWFRGLPTIVKSWASQEPFGDSLAVFDLPAVTAFDSLPAPSALPIGEVVGIASTFTGNGYWQAAAEGLVTAYGDAAYFGDPLGLLNAPVSGIAAHRSAYGYVLVAQDGGVFAFGACPFEGSLPGSNIVPPAPIIGIALTATGNGYWLLDEKGEVYTFGDANYHGNAAVGYPTNKATGIARSAGGDGYIIVATNGGVFCQGDAVFHGSAVDNYVADFVAISTVAGSDGYLLINALGDAYAFGAQGYFGGMTFPLDLPANSVQLTPDHLGYWMSAGDGGVFTFGDAAFFGSVPAGGTTAHGSLSWLRLGAPVTLYYVDNSNAAHVLWEGIVADWEDTTDPSSVGLSIQCAGSLFQADWYLAKPLVDPPFIGYNPETGAPIFGWDIGTAIAAALNGVLYPSPGTAIGNGPRPSVNRPSPVNFGLCAAVTTGVVTVVRGNWDKLLTGYVQNVLAQGQGAGGQQWTVKLSRPRTPVIAQKDFETVNWTISTGGRGVELKLSFDQSTAANVIYGQGQAPPVLAPSARSSASAATAPLALSGAWQNTRYPQLFPGTAPTFPLGATASFAPGDGQIGLLPFTNWLRQSGYPLLSQDTYLTVDFASAVFDFYLIEAWQQDAGIEVTGLIDKTTWDRAFGSGRTEGSQNNVFYMPLAQLPQVEPYTYTPSGSPTGINPFYLSTVPRIERFEQMGQMLTKAQGIVSARIELERIQVPAWTGTIKLTMDPQEGSRFQIKAGDNVLLRYYRGRDTLFHVSKVDADFSSTSMAVTLTVSSQVVDLMTLASIWARDVEAHGVARRARPSLVNLNVSTNNTVFDSESGAGRVPVTPLAATSWTILRVPFSEQGSVAIADFQSGFPLTPFSMAVFSGPVTASDLLGAIGSAGPLTKNAAGNNPWNDYLLTGANGGPGLASLGLLYAAGGPSGACGYYPSDPSGTQTLTGRYVDAQTWPYAPSPGNSPWLWVAFWVPANCFISGRFLPAPS